MSLNKCRIYETDKELIIHNLEKKSFIFIDRVYLYITQIDWPQYEQNTSSFEICYGIVGIIKIASTFFLLFISEYETVGEIFPNIIINKVKEVKFLRISKEKPQLTEELHDIITSIKNLFTSGFYYSSNFNLTTCLQFQTKSKLVNGNDNNLNFLWNHHLLEKFYDYQISLDFITHLIYGYVSINEFVLSTEKIKLILISRRHVENAGTFLFKRGIDANGNVAGFVETEQIVIQGKNIFSFVQCSGTPPVDYKVSDYNPKAFNQHIEKLCDKFKLVFILNLLNGDESEQYLTEQYEGLVKESKYKNVKYSYFNMERECDLEDKENFEPLDDFLDRVESIITIFQFYGVYNVRAHEITMDQRGIIRTNCYDCSERTGIMQMFIAWRIFIFQMKLLHLERYFTSYRLSLENDDMFMEKFKDIWEYNNTQLNSQYCVQMRNMQEKLRQKSIDIVLNKAVVNLKNVNDEIIARELLNYTDRFTSFEELSIFIGTWNVGAKDMKEQIDVKQWLTKDINIIDKTPDIYCIGLQEIVELNANFLLLSSNWQMLDYWKQLIAKTLDEVDKYTLVKYVDMIGLVLFFFIKQNQVNIIKNLDYMIVKAGMMGAIGNKGSCMIKFDYYDTSFAFSCCHLAAGVSSNNSRLSQMTEILNKTFPSDKQKKFSEYCIFFLFGDLNFRIDLEYLTCVQYIKNNKLNELRAHDQLIQSSSFFPYLSEGNIRFYPTYKYIKGKLEYDDKKRRTPSWCDRILHKRSKFIKPLVYSRAELFSSDHRPVMGLFNVYAGRISNKKRNEIINEIKHKLILGFEDEYDGDKLRLSLTYSGKNLTCKQTEKPNEFFNVFNNSNDNDTTIRNSMPLEKMSKVFDIAEFKRENDDYNYRNYFK